jgi:FMN reductase
MSSILLVSASPSRPSRTAALLDHVAGLVADAGHEAVRLDVTSLPADAVLRADTANDAVQAALVEVELADAIVVGTPVYKASYSGVLKAFLDLLPQQALSGKTVLPLATGGTIAHLLSIDYALRPVLQSLCPRHVVPGRFVLDTHLQKDGPDRGVTDPETRESLRRTVETFLREHRGATGPRADAFSDDLVTA